MRAVGTQRPERPKSELCLANTKNAALARLLVMWLPVVLGSSAIFAGSPIPDNWHRRDHTIFIILGPFTPFFAAAIAIEIVLITFVAHCPERATHPPRAFATCSSTLA
jgi:hypothetical protein